MEEKKILDVCCGTKGMWFDKKTLEHYILINDLKRILIHTRAEQRQILLSPTRLEISQI